MLNIYMDICKKVNKFYNYYIKSSTFFNTVDEKKTY